jgi:hypothetical protein
MLQGHEPLATKTLPEASLKLRTERGDFPQRYIIGRGLNEL